MSEGQLRALTLNVKVNCEAITSIIEMALAFLLGGLNSPEFRGNTVSALQAN